jgi:hypothetical protein
MKASCYVQKIWNPRGRKMKDDRGDKGQRSAEEVRRRSEARNISPEEEGLEPVHGD